VDPDGVSAITFKQPLMIELPEFVFDRLKPWPSQAPAGWRFWQYKSLNMHRGILHWDATGAAPKLAELRQQVRKLVPEQFRPSWWRGFGFGVIVSLDVVDDSFQQLADLIDVRNHNKGTWQWMVLHLPSIQSAVGVCTWTEGYLAPVYHDLLAQLSEAGFTCESHKKDMDALMKALTVIHHRLRIAQQLLGGFG
jgi:hypothetical protein